MDSTLELCRDASVSATDHTLHFQSRDDTVDEQPFEMMLTQITRRTPAAAARVLSTSTRAKHTLPDLPYDYNVLPLLLLSR